MSLRFKSGNIELLLTGLSVLSLIILTFLFYLPHIHQAIIPYLWRGWFLPIEGILILLTLAGILPIVGGYQVFFRKSTAKNLLQSLVECWWIGMRIYLGTSWIVVGLSLWTPLFKRYDFVQLVNYIVAEGPFPAYNALLANLVSPNAPVFANLTQYAQLFIGFCLSLGFLTNLASSMGIFLNINFIVALGWADPTWTVTAQNLFAAFQEILFILLLVGRRFGVDELFAKELHLKRGTTSFSPKRREA